MDDKPSEYFVLVYLVQMDMAKYPDVQSIPITVKKKKTCYRFKYIINKSI